MTVRDKKRDRFQPSRAAFLPISPDHESRTKRITAHYSAGVCNGLYYGYLSLAVVGPRSDLAVLPRLVDVDFTASSFLPSLCPFIYYYFPTCAFF